MHKMGGSRVEPPILYLLMVIYAYVVIYAYAVRSGR